MRLVSVLAAATAAGCLSTPPAAGGRDGPDARDAREIDAGDLDAPAGCVDEDGDHWPTGGPQCGRYLDCADDNMRRYPGAREDGSGALDLDCVAGTMAPSTNVPDLQRQPVGTGWRITARTTTVVFHPDASHQLSGLEFSTGPGELLFTDARQDERWSGTNVWQGFFSTQATGTPELTPGDAVLRWRVPFNAGELSGSSHYTITLDGRIQRTDAFAVSGQPPQPAVGKSVTSYIAFDATRFEDVTWAGAGPTGERAIDQVAGFSSYFAPIPDAPTWLCARTPLHDIVWAHGPGTVGPPSNPRPRITSGLGPAGLQLALQYDWSFNVPAVALGAHVGHFLIVPTYRSQTIDCGYGGQIARSYYAPARLAFTGNGSVVVSDPDDVGADGFVEGGAYYLIDAMGGPGLAFAIDTTGGRSPPPVSTFRIRNLPIDPLPVVTRTLSGGSPTVLVHGRDYRIQADGTGLWLVVMVDLQPGSRIDLVRAYQP